MPYSVYSKVRKYVVHIRFHYVKNGFKKNDKNRPVREHSPRGVFPHRSIFVIFFETIFHIVKSYVDNVFSNFTVHRVRHVSSSVCVCALQQ